MNALSVPGTTMPGEEAVGTAGILPSGRLVGGPHGVIPPPAAAGGAPLVRTKASKGLGERDFV